MCYRVIFNYQGKPRTVSSKNPYAKLPVLLRDGQLRFLPWGSKRRSTIGLHEIKATGRLDAYFPKAVKLPIKAFLVLNKDGTSRWFHLPPDKWIQGVVLRNESDIRVFIVSLLESEFNDYLNWPRILVGGNNYL